MDFWDELIADNARRDPDYAPYCMRCPGLVRMVRLNDRTFNCRCGAMHVLPEPEPANKGPEHDFDLGGEG